MKPFHTCQSCIYREASASLYHTTHLLIFKEASYNLPFGEREKTGASFGEDYLYWFELSLDIVLAIYDKEVLLVFLPIEGFPG